MESQDEKNTLGGRVKRYTRVSSAMAGLAAKVAGERYLGFKIDRDKHADDLMQALAGLKGPLMKVAQILATIPEALPPEYTHKLQQLQSDAPPMGWPFVKRRMKAELGPDWQDKFEKFEKEAAAAASLGQVHKAHLHDGRLAACKLQYPEMQTAINADLNQLKLIFSLYEKYDNSISTQYVHDELAARLYEELDYKLEAKHTKMYAEMLKKEKGVHVPDVIDELSTSRLLVTTWLEGDKILNFKQADTETRNEIALNMFRAWYVPFYHYGIIHGDPHLGNYSVRKDLGINLLDYGCVRVFPPKFVGGVIDLYNALRNEDIELAVYAYETWGFESLSKEQVEVLNIWAGFLYSPIMEDRVRPIGEITNGVYGRETAEKVHEELKKLGTVTVPREFVFMDRAALGLGSVFLHLKAEVNWYRLFNDLIADFDKDNLAKAQKGILTKFDIPHH